MQLRILLKVVFLGSLLAISGCQKRAPLVAALPPPPPAPLAPAPEVVAMEDATRAFQANDYARAIVCYEDYLRFAPAGNQRDHALFQLGLIFALPGHAQHDWMRATQHFTQLAAEHPNSSLTAPAKIILELRSEVTQMAENSEQLTQRNRQLSTELERLKQIDSQRRNR